MASKPTIKLTARDYEILDALLKTPMEARQLLAISGSFVQPFTHERLVRRRLSQLTGEGLARCFRYATASSGRVNYYKISPKGYRLLQGHDVTLPPRSLFAPVSLSLQRHTRMLADFVTKLHTTADATGVALGGFYRENQLRLRLGHRVLQPDCAFQIVAEGKQYNFLVELDCGTEPVRSKKQRESLEQKIAFYDQYQDSTKKRFFVLFLFAKPSERMSHFCALADQVIRDRQRTLVLAGLLPHFLETGTAFRNPIFVDRSQRLQSLLPSDSPGVAHLARRKDAEFVAPWQSIW